MARLAQGLARGGDGVIRCWWPGADDLYQRYHDREWGFPVGDDRRLLEKICLEGFQSGLSWLTILRKREAFRLAFDNFEAEPLARYGEPEVERLLQDAAIVRHRGKILSAINNAQRALEIKAEFGSLARYFWTWQPDPRRRPRRISYKALRALSESPESVALSRDLKSRGWTYVGPTTVYAFMQAMGLVNDHLEGCGVRAEAQRARDIFVPPA
jgi:DNA-3-methyladenine glycosylase I